MRQLRIFQEMVARGLIFRHYRPVHYSPSSRSALAEAELEYKDAHVSHAVHVAFDLDVVSLAKSGHLVKLRELVNGTGKAQLLVWTTTPWTLTANMAIAVNPEMRYLAMRSSARMQDGVVFLAADRKEEMEGFLATLELDEIVGEIMGMIVTSLRRSFFMLTIRILQVPISQEPPTIRSFLPFTRNSPRFRFYHPVT